MPPELISLSRAWLAEQTKADHVLVLLLATAVLTYNLWSRLLSKPPDIPIEFWYHVPQSTGALAVSREKKAEARNIAHVFKERNLDIVILWGTQSGRAQLLARRLAKDLHDTFALRTLAADLDDFDPVHLSQLTRTQPVGFVLSTYGDGDPSDNTNALWAFLHAATEKKKKGAAMEENNLDLSSLRYVLFGLGNSNYRLYNRVGTTVDSLLQRLGAVRFGRAGAGDDARGETEDDFVAWRRETQSNLRTELGLTEQEHGYRPAFEVQYDASAAPEAVYLGEPHASLLNSGGTSQLRRVTDAKVPAAMPATAAQRLWETDARLCLHMDLDLGADRLVKYKTGDHLAVWPSNPDHEVRRLLAATGLSGRAHVPIVIRPADGDGDCGIPVPSPTTPDALFRHYLEITGRVSLETASALADFAPSPAAAAALRSMVGDPDTYRTAVSAARLTLADLLEEVGSAGAWDSLPLSFLLERMGPMRPRYYSISSSAAVHPRTVSITAVSDKPPTNQGGPRGCYGLATGYLSALERFVVGAVGPDGVREDGPSYALDGPRGLLSSGKLFASIRQSPFKLPTKSSSPIIMVGAGTGVAPFRAFVQERARRKEVGQEVGKTLLFMGFRNADVDFIYKEEWESWRRALGPDVFGYWTAFSRDSGREKKYVQDLVRAQAKEVMRLLEDTGCRFYICGSAGMARDVVGELGRMRAEITGESEEEAMVWVKRLRKFKTLLEDVWG